MRSYTSVSGGKTSAYMAVHYPTDDYYFAPVLTNDENCIIQDKSLRQYCQDKVKWFDWDSGGCREIDQTLYCLRELEQILGTEIQWISAPFTYDDLILKRVGNTIRAFGYDNARPERPFLPTKQRRICTIAMKVYPMAWHIYLNGGCDPVLAHIGFRWDEPLRVENWKCDKKDMTLHCDIAGQFAGCHRNTSVEYQIARFPLYEDRITKEQVTKYWQGRLQFPTVSNCDFCFFHQASQHKHQYLHHPNRLQWWLEMEKQSGQTFSGVPLQSKINDAQSSLFGDDLEQFGCLCAN